MSSKKEWQLREELCEAGRRLYRAGFMSGSDGNLSVLLNDNEVLITPSRISKGYLEPHAIVKIDRLGNRIQGDLPPSFEQSMHLAAYEERSDICAVAHCHPPILIAFTVAGLQLPGSILPEMEVMFGGEIPLAPYATPGGTELANSIRQLIRQHDVILLDHHGTLSVGKDIFQAAMRTEHAEATAQIVFYTRQLGQEKPLTYENVDKLHSLRQRLLEREDQVFFGGCHQIGNPQWPGRPTSVGQNNHKSLPREELENIVRRVIWQMLEEEKLNP
jgi:L-fuculose-phosphate aldolase